jgi:hypothetical protein
MWRQSSPQNKPSSQGGAERTTFFEIVCGNDLRREDRLGRLGIAALHWNEFSSDENNKVPASGFPGAGLRSSIAGSAENVQFMVKDSKKYARDWRLDGLSR